MMRRARTRDLLEAVGRQRTPAPDPAFVRALEARLGEGPSAAYPVPRVRRRVAAPMAATAVAAAAVVAAIVGLDPTGAATNRVTSEPRPALTTSSILDATTTTTAFALPPLPSTSTTLAGRPATAHEPSPTTVPAAVPTTVVGTEPATTEPPATTTTTRAPSPTTSTTSPTSVPDLHETCTTTPSPATVTCHWDASTDSRFSHFRVVRRTADGPESLVYEGAATNASDRSTVGARVYYIVTAVAADGTVLARGQAGVTCC